MKLSRSLFYSLGCSLLVLGGIGLLLLPIFGRSRENDRKSSCQSNLKQIALGVFQYTQDYHEKFPIVAVNEGGVSASNPYGWADALQPYLKSTHIYRCPNHPFVGNDDRPTQPQARNYSDYYYNSRMAGQSQEKISSVASLITLADGNDGLDYSNSRYSKKMLPPQWRNDQNSPAYRHNGGANYAFADGHVKWLKPEDVSNNRNGQMTFANP